MNLPNVVWEAVSNILDFPRSNIFDLFMNLETKKNQKDSKLKCIHFFPKCKQYWFLLMILVFCRNPFFFFSRTVFYEKKKKEKKWDLVSKK